MPFTPKLSDDEKIALSEFLKTQLYQRAKLLVLNSSQIDALGSPRSVEHLNLDLAIKEGMRKAFDDLEDLIAAEQQPRNPVAPKQLQKTVKK